MVHVNLSEAYERLGVEPGTDPKTARRAYLKLIKVHKPETDPETFKQIREAYEAIKSAPQWEIEALARGPAPEPAPPPGAPEAPDVGGPAPGWGNPQPAASSWSKPKRSWKEQVKLSHEGKLFDDPKPAPDAAPKPAPRPPPAELPPLGLGPFTMKDFYDRGRHATDAQRVQIGREAVQHLPDDPEAHWMLHEALIVASRISEAAAALRAAHQRGLPGFLEPLLRQHPEELGAADLIEARQQAGVTLEALTVANAFLSRGDGAGAAEAIRQGLEQARQGNEDKAPSIHMALDFVLRLVRGGHVAPGRAAFLAMQRWLTDTGREVELGGSQAGATYALTKELLALPDDFPADVTVMVARAILDGDPSYAHGELVGWLRNHPDAVRKVEEQLTVYAPSLHNALRYAIQDARAPAPNAPPVFSPKAAPVHSWPGAVTPPPPKKSYGWVAWLVAVVVLVGLRIALGSSSPRPRYDIPTFDYNPPRVPDLSGIQGIGGVGAGPTNDMAVRSAATSICIWESQAPHECQTANGLRDALLTHDCPLARNASYELEQAIDARSRQVGGGLGTSGGSGSAGNQALNNSPLIGMLMRRHQQTLARAVRARCGADEGMDPPPGAQEEDSLDVGDPAPHEDP